MTIEEQQIHNLKRELSECVYSYTELNKEQSKELVIELARIMQEYGTNTLLDFVDSQ